MIGWLSGRVAWKGSDHVLLDVRGVGYVVYVSDRTLADLPAPGNAAALHTDLLVREDLLQLFGFVTLQEKEWHRLLTSVQGIGAKASLAILSTLGPEGVSRAIALGDWAAVKAAQGVGPKLAQRVVNELQGRAAEVMAMGAEPSMASAPVAEAAPEAPAPLGGEAETPKRIPPQAPAYSGQADALSALLNLGYGQSEAARAIAEAADMDDNRGAGDASALIRAALKRLAPQG